jgi:hypothetical protein
VLHKKLCQMTVSFPRQSRIVGSGFGTFFVWRREFRDNF